MTLPNCDCCGRFVLPGAPGTSWVRVPSTDVNYGDERDRCARCTEKHGPALCSPEYRRALCCGVVPKEQAK
jgi:hypothetical protein